MEQVGSGVLLSIGQFTFLLTAGHVLDLMQKGDLLVPCKSGILGIEGSFAYVEMPNPGLREQDKLDVGYFKLDKGFVADLHQGIGPASIDDILFLDDSLQAITYTFAGYPWRKSVTDGHKIESEIFKYSGMSVPEEIYSRLGYDPSRNIIARFDRNRSTTPSGERYTPPLPHGISGGGVYAWTNWFDGMITPDRRRLVGIAHTFLPHEKLFVGTSMEMFLVAISKNNPDLFGDDESPSA